MKTHIKQSLLTIACLLCSIGVYAHSFYMDGIYYNILNETEATVEVTYRGKYYFDYENEYTGTVEIPESVTYNGTNYSVTSIGYAAFSYCTGLTEISIPNSVTSIGEWAFNCCTGLTEVTIPNSVTSIGYSAFEYCSGLTEVTIPNSVTSIGSSAFDKTPFYNNLQDGLIYFGCVLYEYKGTMPSNMVIDIKEGTVSVSPSAFSGCTGLTEVTIPNSITSIGTSAFYGCTGLTTVNFNAENCTSMGSYSSPVFEGCSNLTTVNIGEAVKMIPNCAFYNCTGLTSVIIPNSITSIGRSAFYGCTFLTEVTIPNSVTSIGERAFSGCTGLTTVNFNAENCTTMGTSSYPVFEGCTNLKTLNIGESVKIIPDNAFRECTGLTSVTIGNSVTSIGSYAFYGCNIAKTIWLTNTPPNGYKNVSSKVHYVANEQYKGLSNVKIYPYISSLFETGGVRYVPVSPSERTCDAIDCCYDSTATNIQIDSIVLYKGVAMTVKEVMPYTLYNQDYIKTLSINNSGNIGNYACYDCDSISSAILTNNGNVGEEAFYSCKNLTTVSLGDSIKSIGSNAFENCTTLSKIVIPNGVISIGVSTFNGCTSMTKAIVGNGVTSIGSSAFGGCASLDSIYIGRKVATVGENAFSDCKKLPNITIPAGVTTIGDYVFRGCTSLSDVVIEDRTSALSLGSNGLSGLFADCPLDSVYIGGKITYKTSSSYGYSPFYRNTSLRTVVITDTETEIYDNEFYGCSNLTKVTIGDGVKKIGNWAFSGCSSLDHFAFGTNVESIGQEAFSDCTNVTNIRSYSAVPPVCGTQALDDINKWNCTLSVLENCQSAYQTAEQWKDFFFVNAMDKDGKVVAPVITVDSVVVTISCETAKTTIYYTTDGSEPTVESVQYTGPFVVDKNCTIKAIAVRTNYYNSDVSTAQVDYFVYAESIAIDYETVSIRLNESVTLTATVLPETTANKVVVWSSSDENIATVENGIVTAHTIGEATITATTTDGTNLSATCKVTVLPILADTITLDQTNITAMEGEAVVLTATIYPEDATEKGVVWSVSDATIATIEPIDNVSAKITVLREGVATITATTIDGSNLSATCTIDVHSGIKNVQLDDTPTEYYDLSGRRVEHPTQGVYITKQGSTVRKVVVNER